jgi:hypothetical protein
METAVIMKRRLFDSEISQNSKTGFFSATDLMRAGNRWRINNSLQILDMNDWFNRESSKEFIKSLEVEFGVVKISGRGRGVHTWIHPYLFIDMALALSPTLKIKVYSWIYDALIQYRNDSGDSYKKMAGALWLSQSNKSAFTKDICDIANRIREFCGVADWQEASERQLRLRDKIHEYIALLSDIVRERNNLLDVSFERAKREIDE